MKLIYRTFFNSIASILALVLMLFVPHSSAALAKSKHARSNKKEKSPTSDRASRVERRRAEIRRRTKAARRAAALRQRALDEAIDRGQSRIAKDGTSGEHPPSVTVQARLR